MYEVLLNTIKALRHQIDVNLTEIKNNELSFKQSLAYTNNEEVFTEFIIKNKKLLLINFEIINLQLTILKLIKNNQLNPKPLQTTAKDIQSENMKFAEALYQTINGQLLFSESHPYFDDSDFFDQLIQHFAKNENYEKCAELVSIKKMKKINETLDQTI